MKKLLLLALGLFGLCTLGSHAARADGDYGYRRGDDCDYRRPVYREQYQDDCDYRPRQRVIVREYYEQPAYRVDYYRPRHRHHVNFFLPLPF